MRVTYGRTSPYATTPQTNTTIGIYRHRNIPANVADRQITITQKYVNRPDLLSFDLYGTPEFWWVFCVRNPNVIRDSIWDMTLGATITVPSDEHLRKIIG